MWNWLASLGKAAMSGLQYAGQGIGKVGQEIGEGVTTGVKQVAKIPERLKLNRPDSGMARTPGFNPAAGGALPIVKTQMPGLTPLRPAPANFSLAQDAPVALAPRSQGPPLPVRPELNPEGVPIPSLPGRPGGPMPYDPVNKARYDYVMNGAQWEDTGELAGDSNVRLQKPVFKRNWKDALINAGLGAAQQYAQTGDFGAALGGGLAGGVGTAINPMAGREFRFDTLEGPRMEEQRQAQLEREALLRQAEMGQVRMDDLRSQIEARRSRETMEQAKAERESRTASAMEQARKAQAKAARYKPFSNVAMFDTETGQFVPIPEGMRPASPAQDRQLRNDLDRDIQAFEKEKAAASNPRNKNRQQSMQQHAATAQRIKQLYGDAVEVGQSNGWWYIKPKIGMAQAPLMRSESELENLLR